MLLRACEAELNAYYNLEQCYCSLTYRFSLCYSACITGGQHDGHLSFLLPAFVKLISFFVILYVLLADDEINKTTTTASQSEDDTCSAVAGWYDGRRLSVQVLYQLTMKTQPNNALYEATVQHNLQTGLYHVSSRDISRINRYASQPSCIASRLPHLRPYCYCTHWHSRIASNTVIRHFISGSICLSDRYAGPRGIWVVRMARNIDPQSWKFIYVEFDTQ